MNKFLSLISAYTLAMSVISSPLYAKEVEKVEKLFDVNEQSQFFINNINGNVQISQWSQDKIGIEATKEAKSQKDLDRMILKINQLNDRVSVETEYLKKNSYDNGSGSVDFIIHLPEHMKKTHIELVNGTLAIKEIAGDLDAELVNGSIKVSDLAGNAKLHSVNGSIKATYKQVNKDVKDIDISTVNGSIKLNLPQTINAKVEAETMHGSLKSDFDLSVDKSLFTGKTMEGQIGSGNIQIELDSVNGSIKVLEKG